MVHRVICHAPLDVSMEHVKYQVPVLVGLTFQATPVAHARQECLVNNVICHVPVAVFCVRHRTDVTYAKQVSMDRSVKKSAQNIAENRDVCLPREFVFPVLQDVREITAKSAKLDTTI